MACQTPCDQCPWRRNTTNPPVEGGIIGGSDVTTYIGQVYGPFWLPCHKSKNYDLRRIDPSKVVQCAGAAAFRARIGVAHLMPPQLLHTATHPDVFENIVEMLAFYRGKPQVEAMREIIELGGPLQLLENERNKQCVQKFTQDLKIQA